MPSVSTKLAEVKTTPVLIVAVPPAYAEEVLERVASLIQRHADVQQILERGEITNIAAIRQELEISGHHYLDKAWGK